MPRSERTGPGIFSRIINTFKAKGTSRSLLQKGLILSTALLTGGWWLIPIDSISLPNLKDTALAGYTTGFEPARKAIQISTHASAPGPASDKEILYEVIEGKVSRNQTLWDILGHHGVPVETILNLARQTRPTFNLNRLQRGTPYSIKLAEDNRLVSFAYHLSPDQQLVVKREDDAFNAQFVETTYRTETDILEGTVEDNLITTILEAGGSHKVTFDLEEIFAWEINFFKDLRKGDSFKILVEKRFRGGTFAGFGEILAVEFTNQGNPLKAVLFTGRDQHGAYYTPEGQPLRKQFLKSPLRYTRITSRFTRSRYHPIYKEHLPHLGVDYAAPRGTPIRAIGGGRVVTKSRSGRSGNHIRLKHPNGYVSTYSHLSRYAKGLKKGDKVEQGEVIGYVGATGAATGPHLCFHMYKHGKPVNPLKFQSPKGKPLDEERLQEFSEMAANRMATLNGETIHVRRAGTRHPAA